MAKVTVFYDRVGNTLDVWFTKPQKVICEELRTFSEVAIEENQAIVCLVGDNLRFTPGVASRVFRAVEPVNVRMISQGASLLNLSFVVAEADLKRAVELLHEEFFRELDPRVFETNGVAA